MKPLAALAFALLVLPAQSASARAPEEAPSAALVDRFIAVLPDRDAIGAAGREIDSAELSRLTALNPGKEAQVRAKLQENLDCIGPETEAVSLRMLRTVARNLGDVRLRRMIHFYQGPDYAVFAALAPRMERRSAPSAKDKAAIARLMKAYPLQAFQEQMAKAGQIIAADQAFMGAAMRCASQHRDAMTAAGLKAN